MPPVLATVSVDIDPIEVHLRGYGVTAAPDAKVYELAVPRLLSLFAAASVQATFFVVAQDAGHHAATLRAITAAGHEVASHSLTHPAPFAKLPPDRLRHELAESKRLLEAAVGSPVVGFRAPNWDCDRTVLDALGAAGYRYDASAYPSPFLLAARLLVGGLGRLRSWPFSWRLTPHRLGPVHEFPIGTTGPHRLPVYHTLRYGMREERFARILDGFVRAQRPLGYALHAVDVLGLREDGVDERLARHPGMKLPLADKQALLANVLGAVSARFRAVSYRTHLAELGAG